MRNGFTRIAEALLLGLLALAPWPFGCASDTARYALLAAIFVALTLWAAGLCLAKQGLPPVAPWIALVPLATLPPILLVHPFSLVLWVEASLALWGGLGVALFWSDCAHDRNARLRLTAIVLLTCAAEAGFGAAQWSETPGRLYGRHVPIVTAPFGSFVNHNHFAGLLEMGALLACGMTGGFLRRGGISSKAVASGGLAFGLVAAHLASASRGGLLALFAGLVALISGFWMTWFQKGSVARVGFLAASALVLVALNVTFLPGETLGHFRSILWGTSEAAGAYRVDVTRGTLRLALAHPVWGAGLGNFPDAFTAFKPDHGYVRTTHAEDDVVEFLSETGLMGFAALLALGAACLGGLRDRLRTGKDPLHLGLALGAFAGCAALAAHSFLDFNLRIPSNALVFASLVGLMASPRSERPPLRAGTAMLAVCVFVSGSALSLERAVGARALANVTTIGDPSERLVALDRVLSRHPYLPEGLRERGKLWLELSGRPNDPLTRARLGRAARDFEGVIRLRSGWSEPWADLGWVLFRLGDSPAADRALEHAVALDPTNLQVGVTRADFDARTRGPESGIRDLVRLRQVNPEWHVEEALRIGQLWTDDPNLLATLRK